MLKAAGMSSSKAAKSKRTDPAETSSVSSIWSGSATVVGEVCRINSDGSFVVDYPHNILGPVEARTLIEDLHTGAKVLVTFERGDPSLPIVLGLVHDRVRTQGRVLHLKANNIILEADEQLTLRCGEGRVEATRNGNVRIAGKDVVSRASRNNKVQGATVRLN